MRRLALLLAVAAAACNGPRGDAPATPSPSPTPARAATPPAPPPTPTASATASVGSNGARSVSEETDDFLFEYSYPKEAGRIPALARLLDGRLEHSRAELAQQSAAARKDARGAGFPYNKYSLTIAWKVVSDLPEWLSLSAKVSSYAGGAHGNYGFDSLVWDKQHTRALQAIDLFQSPAALDKAVGDRFCDALNAERARRRGAPVKKTSRDEFDKCVGVKEATVLVGSRGHRKFDRLSLQIGPYVAGPYAEGAYEFAFPVDARILAAVKPEFQDAFASRK